MKKLLGSMIMASALSFAYAEGEGAPEKGQMLDKAKADATQMIDMRIKALQESKACISKASSREEMHKCREEAKNDMKEFKEVHQEKRKDWKEKREEWKGKREDWKNKRKEMRAGGGTEAPTSPEE